MRLDYIDCCDCLEGMKQIPDGSIDLVLTDPPYGINYSSNMIKDKSRRLGGIMGDRKPFVEFVEQALWKLKKTGAAYIFVRWDVQQKFIDELMACEKKHKLGFKVKNIIIWDKGAHGMGDLKRAYGSRYESVIFAAGPEFRFTGKRPVDIIRAAKVAPQKLRHPNEKPVRLLEELMCDGSAPGSVVFDPFMGSGTTAEACIRASRHFIGFERDPKYHKIAVDRVEAVRKEIEGI